MDKASRIGIAIIPARGGSKRIPKKNIKSFLGKPVIHYPIEAALSSEVISDVIVSTDSEEIAQYVDGIPHVKVHWRPAFLADDITPTVPVVCDAVMSNKLDGNKPVCCIYPVNPFIEKTDLELGHKELLLNPEVSYVNSICTYPYPIQRAIKQDSFGMIEMINPEMALIRSQDLEECFHDAGQWYWGLASTWLRQDKLLFNSKGIKIPRWRCQDIDTFEDWESSEKLYQASKL